MTGPIYPFMPVVPHDAFGREDRHRKVRFLAETNGQYRSIFWCHRMPDESVSFGLTTESRVNTLGLARIVDGTLKPFQQESTEAVPLPAREKIHVTLHPSGLFQMRANGHEPLLRHDLSGWFPV